MGRLWYLLLLLGGNNILAMYDGEPTTVKKVPYMGIIYDEGLYTCFATIIGDSWLVTTANCMKGEKTGDLTVRVGANSDQTGVVHKVSKIVKHPKHSGKKLDYNYALVQIQGNFTWNKKVKAANLPTARPQAGTELTVSSYGAPDFDGDLKKGTMSVITNANCTEMYEGKATVNLTERIGCLYNPGRTTLCDGDWASPAVANNTLFYTMIMYDPAGTDCENDSNPTLMADISTVVTWITEITGITP